MPRTTTKRTRTGMYGGVTAEQRQADRRRRLMDAALEMIGTEGWSKTTLRGVCERASVGPRFFYESFENLDELAAAVLDEIVHEALAKVLSTVADAPDLPEKAHRALEVFIGEVTDDPRRARLLFSEAHGSEVLMARRFALVRTIAQVLAEQARQFLRIPEGSEQLTQAAALVLTGGVAEMVLAWLDGDLDLSREELVDLSAELLLTTAANAPATTDRIMARSRSRVSPHEQTGASTHGAVGRTIQNQ
jgi:AcrR family transcriptional regulator